MTVTLTLNEISVEQANKILKVAKGEAPKKEAEETVEESKKEFEEILPQNDKPTHSIEDVRKALAELAKTKGKDSAKGILNKFGANKVTELDSSKFDEVMNDISGVS